MRYQLDAELLFPATVWGRGMANAARQGVAAVAAMAGPINLGQANEERSVATVEQVGAFWQVEARAFLPGTAEGLGLAVERFDWLSAVADQAQTAAGYDLALSIRVHECHHDEPAPHIPCVILRSRVPAEPPGEDPPGPAPWVQPTGAHDAYPTGAQVTFNGQTWQNTIPANVWAPGTYGWTVIL